MTSVMIAAHNEEAVIGACMDALASQDAAGPVEVVVAANGCSDGTAAVARARGAVVVELAEAGKAGALNACDAAATGFPRLYLDADIVLPAGALRAVADALGAGGVFACAPTRTVDTRGCAWPVKAYFAINERLPVFASGLFGRGMIALSQAGRSRFDRFPAIIADDLFVDSQFTAAEKSVMPTVRTVVAAPRTTRALVRRLARVRRGNAQLRATAASGQDGSVAPSRRWAWLGVVVARPRLAAAAVPYLALTVLAAVLARQPAGPGAWGRDETTRARGTLPTAEAPS